MAPSLTLGWWCGSCDHAREEPHGRGRGAAGPQASGGCSATGQSADRGLWVQLCSPFGLMGLICVSRCRQNPIPGRRLPRESWEGVESTDPAERYSWGPAAGWGHGVGGQVPLPGETPGHQDRPLRGLLRRLRWPLRVRPAVLCEDQRTRGPVVWPCSAAALTACPARPVVPRRCRRLWGCESSGTSASSRASGPGVQDMPAVRSSS